MPRMPAEDEVLSWFEKLSNWARWGPDDRLGTLNHVTPAKRVAAAKLVQVGELVSCSWDLRTGRQPGATVENQRYMLSTGLGLGDEGRRNLLGEGRAGGAQEFIGMVFHGLDVTHLDSLAHMFWDGKMYGGVPASMVSDRQGALVHDVLAVSNGVTSRGVLLDIARLRGVDVLAADDHVYPQDLDAAADAAGIAVGPGDVVLMRTGEGGARRAAGKSYNANCPLGVPGGMLALVHERGVAMLGVRCRPRPDAVGLSNGAHADSHGWHRGHGAVADRQLPVGGPRRDVRPAGPLGVPVHAGADPVPGRHRQPGQPTRRILMSARP